MWPVTDAASSTRPVSPRCRSGSVEFSARGDLIEQPIEFLAPVDEEPALREPTILMVVDLDGLEANRPIGSSERNLAQCNGVLAALQDIVDVQLPGLIPLRREEPVPDLFASSNGSCQSRVAEDVPLRILTDRQSTQATLRLRGADP
jgi:hypothetical protein